MASYGTLPSRISKEGDTGWIQYKDTQFTETNPLSIEAGSFSDIPNNAGSIIRQFSPPNVTDFYDSTTGRIIVDTIGDGMNFTFLFNIISSQEKTNISFGVDIGGGIGRIFNDKIIATESAGVLTAISLSFSGYMLGTWAANGGVVQIKPQHDIEISNITYVIGRYHKA